MTETESVINIKKKDYKNIVDKVVEHQYTINVLNNLMSKSHDMTGGEIENKNTMSADDKNAEIKTGSASSKASVFKKKVTIESASESDTTDSETSDSDSSSYENTSDIYHATESEDGINKAYNKLNQEMNQIYKLQKGGKMSGKAVVKRINFLLNGLQILDSVKKSNSNRKRKK